MRIRTLILTCAMAALLIVPAISQDGSNPPGKISADESAKKIKDLEQERLATLRFLADVAKALYKNAQDRSFRRM